MMKFRKIFNIVMLGCVLVAAAGCSEEKIIGDPEKDWSGTNYYPSVDETGFSTYYMPQMGRVGDPMPFYDQKSGDFKVLYLQEYEQNMTYRFHPIWAVSTKDGCNYQSMGELLPVGANDYVQDAAIGTGCAYYSENEGLYYIYYTGENGHCKSRQVVMRATSPDFKTWTKDDSWALNGTDYGFSGNDFRDPQIFKEGEKYHMVISTYPITGGDPRFAEFVSSDMKNWEPAGSFKMIWDRMLECPDIFQMGNYWYLVYSESKAEPWSRKVKYMMADSWENLKRCFNDGPKWPADDREGVLDTRAFYAGKTASNGTDRYIWGWAPYRSGKDNHEKNLNVGASREPNWSGALVCHKLYQLADGTLSIAEVPAMAAKYNKPVTVTVKEQKDEYTLYSRLETHNHISFTVKTEKDGDAFGISFGRGSDAPFYYTLKVNPEENGRRKVNFEQNGEGGMGFVPGADGYIMPHPENNTYKIDIYTDNSVVVMYINGIYGTTHRIHGAARNCWSINAYDGAKLTVSDLNVTQY